MYIKNFEKKYQEKWENTYLRIKMQALPGP